MIPAANDKQSPEDGVSLARFLEEASGGTGLTDYGKPTFFTTVELLVDSCRATARLTPSGWAVLRKVVVRHLRNQLYLQAYLSAAPVAAGDPITAPAVITGLPRTGTTLLHNLLALDPANRFLRFWEGLHPVPVVSDAGQAALVAQAEKWLERMFQMTPEFRSIHFSTARGPEECDALLQNAFASQHFDDMFQAEAYSEWLNHASLDTEYSYYAVQLQALAATDGERRSWVLKSPSHLGYIDTVLRTFPGALIVHCHRDPVEAVASYASLVRAVRAPHTDHLSLDDVGRHALNRCLIATDRALQVRDQRGPDNFFDVSYRRLLDDPLSVVRRLYSRLGRSLLDNAETAMIGWLGENPQYKRGRHDYSLERFGLEARSLRSGMARYFDRFGAEIG